MSQEILYGITPVEEALKAERRGFFSLTLKQGKQSPRLQDLRDLALERGVEVREKDPAGISRMADTEQHQGVALVCSPLPGLDLEDLLALEELPSLILALDQIEDPQNLGAITRSAAFLGATGILHLNRKAAPLSPAASKASAGALERFPVALVGNLADALSRLQQAGYFVYGADASRGSTPYSVQPRQERLVVVLGNEGKGLRELTKKKCDSLIHIPGNMDTESLNVSNAAAILLSHFGPHNRS